MGVSITQRYPLLLPTLSLIIGINFGKKIFFSEWIIYPSSALWLCLLFLVFLILFYPIKTFRYRWFYGLLCCFFFLIFGLFLSIQELTKTNYTFPITSSVYKVQLVSSVLETDKSLSVDARILAVGDSIGLKPTSHNSIVKLFFEKDSAVYKLHCDDEILIFSQLKQPQSNLNFESFDYGNFLRLKGFSGSGYVSKDNWSVLSSPSKHSLRFKSLYAQQKVVQQYETWGLDDEALSIISALTVGYKDDLTSNLKSAFSSAGVSHVLALSGLHVGFIYLLFMFVLKKIGRNKPKIQCLGKLIIVCILWGFAFVVGGTPSVVRAVFMFSLFTLSTIITNGGDSKQTLCIACFLMLLYNPLWLFDVGFQLSFIAVASILILLPVVKPLIVCKTRLGKYIWDTCSVSLVAQIGVLPIILYCFSSFPLYFLLGNLLIIPLVSIIVYLSFVSLLICYIPYLSIPTVYLLNKLLSILTFVVRWIEQIPYSSIDNIWLSKAEVLILFLVLIAVAYLLYNPSYTTMRRCLSCLIIFLVVHFYYQYKSTLKTSIEFYSVKNCPAVHCIESTGESFLLQVNDTVEYTSLYSTMKKYWSHHHLHPACLSDSCYSNTLFYKKPLLVFHDYKIAVVDVDCRNLEVRLPKRVNMIYLSKGFRGSISDVLAVFSSPLIILDSSLSYYLQEQIITESKEKSIECIPLLTKGSCCFSL
ncbi:MAG: ComEC/Rec2 family competence protein [Bacteroides sp.]|nr:ComEC/Rec2 family competence protein [Bacteroides sp.]MDD4719910.1 ComEC/Rec2 family competence protein [Bacteroides sp.]